MNQSAKRGDNKMLRIETTNSFKHGKEPFLSILCYSVENLRKEGSGLLPVGKWDHVATRLLLPPCRTEERIKREKNS